MCAEMPIIEHMFWTLHPTSSQSLTSLSQGGLAAIPVQPLCLLSVSPVGDTTGLLLLDLKFSTQNQR